MKNNKPLNLSTVRRFVTQVVSSKEEVPKGSTLKYLCMQYKKLFKPQWIKIYPTLNNKQFWDILKKIYRKHSKQKIKSTLDYKTYIKSEIWKLVVARIKKQRNNSCEICGNKKYLQVHHLTYKNLGQEKDEDLQLLCGACHMKQHGIEKKIDYNTFKE